jgi:hypothetical protein
MCPGLASKRSVPHTVSSHTVLYDDPSLDNLIFVFCSQLSLLREHDLAYLSYLITTRPRALPVAIAAAPSANPDLEWSHGIRALTS